MISIFSHIINFFFYRHEFLIFRLVLFDNLIQSYLILFRYLIQTTVIKLNPIPFINSSIIFGKNLILPYTIHYFTYNTVFWYFIIRGITFSEYMH